MSLRGLPREEREVIKTVWKEADRRAKQHGLDKKRVREVFERLAEIGWLAPNYPFETGLDEAISDVGPAKALQIFEEENLEDLARKVSFLDFVRDEFSPVYTLEQLADLAETFLDYLERNRESLTQTGFPGTNFSPSRWFDWHHTKTYFVKLPVTIQDNRSPQKQAEAETTGKACRDDKGNLVYSYAWAEEPALPEVLLPESSLFGERVICKEAGYWWTDDVPHAETEGTPTRCSYEKAALLPGMQLKVADRLGVLREKVVDLRCRVLKELIFSLRRRNAEGLWQRCLVVVADSMSTEDAEFLLEADRFYVENLPLGNSAVAFVINPFVHHNAGLTELLLLIGHVEKELEIGTMDGIAGSLGFDSRGFLDHLQRRLEDEGIQVHDRVAERVLKRVRPKQFRSYYETFGTKWKGELDASLERFLSFEEKEAQFWEEFGAKVNDALENDFKMKVMIETYVKARHEAEFRAVTEGWAKIQAVSFDTTGRPMFTGGVATSEETEIPGSSRSQSANDERGLTGEQQTDYRQQGFKCREKIYISGTFDSTGRNVVVGNNGQVSLGPRQLHLLLLFISASKNREGGWVDPDELIPLHFDPRAPQGGKYQPLSRLREKLRPALQSDPKELFEHGFDPQGKRRYRLSTHPDFITYDKKKLLLHPDPDINKIADRLP